MLKIITVNKNLLINASNIAWATRSEQDQGVFIHFTAPAPGEGYENNQSNHATLMLFGENAETFWNQFSQL